MSPVHVDLQAPAPHANGKHEVEAGTTQLPEPSQVPAGISVVPEAGQLAPLHATPGA